MVKFVWYIFLFRHRLYIVVYVILNYCVFFIRHSLLKTNKKHNLSYKCKTIISFSSAWFVFESMSLIRLLFSDMRPIVLFIMANTIAALCTESQVRSHKHTRHKRPSLDSESVTLLPINDTTEETRCSTIR